jgi:hypothetical protein
LAAFISTFVFLYLKKLTTPSSKGEHEDCVIGARKSPNGIVIGGGCSDIWNYLHLLLWILIGLLVPGMYIPALVISILFELGEQITIGRGRIEDVFINMAGYTIGSLLSKAR